MSNEQRMRLWAPCDDAPTGFIPYQRIQESDINGHCPWCLYELADTRYDSDNGPGPYDCVSCGKTLFFEVDLDGTGPVNLGGRGEVYIIGQTTKADKKYAAWKSGEYEAP